MDLAGITAIVTGASGGIGREIAVAFGEAGANVALAARGDGIHETAERLPDGAALPVRTDVTAEASVEESIAATVDTFGGLDCLVNNAGIAGPTAPTEAVSVEAFERTLDVNLVGAFRMAKHAIPHLRESEGGRIINIGSTGGKQPYENRSPYSTSKAGLIGLSRTLSHELAEAGVTVNTINPGPTAGQRAEEVFAARAEGTERTPEEIRRSMEDELLPMGEMVQPDEVAALATFLASGAAPHLTSQDISIASGLVWW